MSVVSTPTYSRVGLEGNGATLSIAGAARCWASHTRRSKHRLPSHPDARHRAAVGTTGRYIQLRQPTVLAAAALARPRSQSRPVRPGWSYVSYGRQARNATPEAAVLRGPATAISPLVIGA